MKHQRVVNRSARSCLAHLVLLALAVAMVTPFAWMVLSSFKPLAEVENANPIPSTWRFQNYADVFRQIPFARYYLNSFFVAAWVTFLQCLTSAMAAYSFARLRWPGRDTVFKLYLATIMIPGVVTPSEIQQGALTQRLRA